MPDRAYWIAEITTEASKSPRYAAVAAVFQAEADFSVQEDALHNLNAMQAVGAQQILVKAAADCLLNWSTRRLQGQLPPLPPSGGQESQAVLCLEGSPPQQVQTPEKG